MLHTNVADNLIKPILCFHIPKTLEGQKFPYTFNEFRKETLT